MKTQLTFQETHKYCPKDLPCQICVCAMAKGKGVMWICPVCDLKDTTWQTNYD